MHPARLMWMLFELDQERDRVKETLQTIEGRLRGDARVVQARADVDDVERRLRRDRARQTELEDELSQITTKLSETQKALYGGAARHPKELQSMQEETDYLTRRSGRLQESLLELLADIEATHKELEEAGARLATLEGQWGELQDDLSTEYQNLTVRMKRLEDRREDLMLMMKEEHLAVYRDISERKGGIPIARLVDGVCQACGIDLPRAEVLNVRDSEELVFCPNCGRVLVAD